MRFEPVLEATAQPDEPPSLPSPFDYLAKNSHINLKDKRPGQTYFTKYTNFHQFSIHYR